MFSAIQTKSKYITYDLRSIDMDTLASSVASLPRGRIAYWRGNICHERLNCRRRRLKCLRKTYVQYNSLQSFIKFLVRAYFLADTS